MKSINSLLENFCQCVIDHQKYTQEGDWKKGNAEIKKIIKIHTLIKGQGIEAQKKLLELIYSDNPAIASFAALYSMRFCPNECLAVFENLAKRNIPLISLDASYAIKNWQNNNWDIG